MAYSTGSVTTFEELKNAIHTACVAAGWALADGILSKGAAFIKLTAAGDGVFAEGGTGQNGAALINGSGAGPRLGVAGRAHAAPTFPATYFVLVHSNPDEVFVLLRSNIDAYYYLSFGLSNVPGCPANGLWISATGARANWGSYDGSIQINESSGLNGHKEIGYGWGGVYETIPYASGPWWNIGAGGQVAYAADIIYLGKWCVSGALEIVDRCNAIQPLVPLMAHSPNTWNSESVLLPIRVHQGMPEGKNRLAAELNHARYLRIGNYDNEQVIVRGTEKWKVFPFFRKNQASPNSSGGNQHTGTFGWAIHYDGP